MTCLYSAITALLVFLLSVDGQRTNEFCNRESTKFLYTVDKQCNNVVRNCCQVSELNMLQYLRLIMDLMFRRGEYLELISMLLIVLAALLVLDSLVVVTWRLMAEGG